MRRLGAAVGMVFLLAGCGSGGSSGSAEEPKESPLETAATECQEKMASDFGDTLRDDAPDWETLLNIQDDGESVIVSTPEPGGEIASSIALAATLCVLGKTDAPETIQANMSNTSALMGRQTEEYDGIEVAWSYAAGVDTAGFNSTFSLTD